MKTHIVIDANTEIEIAVNSMNRIRITLDTFKGLSVCAIDRTAAEAIGKALIQAVDVSAQGNQS